MLRPMQRIVSQPLYIIAIGWSLILSAPYLPGVPRPSQGGLPWRQEVTLALLLTLWLGLMCGVLMKRGWQSFENSLRSSHTELLIILPATLFAIWSSITGVWASLPNKAIYQSLTWWLYIVFFLAIRRVFSSARLSRASFITLGTVLLTLSFACMVDFWGTPVQEDGTLVKTMFLYFSGFSEMLAIGVTMFAAFALHLRRRRAAVFCGATATFAWLATLQASQRAPVIGCIVGLLLLLTSIFVKRELRTRRIFKRAALLTLAFALATMTLLIPLGSHNLSSLERLHSTSIHDDNLHVRFLYWGIAFEMFRSRPLTGIGAGNYEDSYTQARAQYSAKHLDDPLTAMHDGMLIRWTHNQYIQVLAETGGVGLLLFTLFGLAVAFVSWRAWRTSRAPLLVAGATGGLIGFSLAAITSVNALVWLGGGLMFFFATAFITHCAMRGDATSDVGATEAIFGSTPQRISSLASPLFISPRVGACALTICLVMSLAMLVSASHRAGNAIALGKAESSTSAQQAEERFRRALAWDANDVSTHFEYGMFLCGHDRWHEAIPHLRYGVTHGFNESSCYAYLALSQSEANDAAAAEQTLAEAVKVYPLSVFLRVRHAKALRERGDEAQAAAEEKMALSLDARAARGWQEFINFGSKKAALDARADSSIMPPNELSPETCIYPVLAENLRRGIETRPDFK